MSAKSKSNDLNYNDTKEIYKFDNMFGELEFYKKRCDVLEKDLIKSQNSIKKLDSSLKKLQNFTQVNAKHLNNTSISFFLTSEFKNIWENFSKDMIMETFENTFDDYFWLYHILQDTFLTIFDETYQIILEKISNILKTMNIEEKNPAKFLSRFRDFFQEFFNSVFIFSDDILERIRNTLLNICEKEYKGINEVMKKNIENDIKNKQFKNGAQVIFKICVYMLLHEPQLTLNITPYPNREIQYSYYSKNEYLNIEGFGNDQSCCIIILSPPMIRNSFPFQGIKPSVYIIQNPSEDIIKACDDYRLLKKTLNPSFSSIEFHTNSSPSKSFKNQNNYNKNEEEQEKELKNVKSQSVKALSINSEIDQEVSAKNVKPEEKNTKNIILETKQKQDNPFNHPLSINKNKKIQKNAYNENTKPEIERIQFLLSNKKNSSKESSLSCSLNNSMKNIESGIQIKKNIEIYSSRQGFLNNEKIVLKDNDNKFNIPIKDKIENRLGSESCLFGDSLKKSKTINSEINFDSEANFNGNEFTKLKPNNLKEKTFNKTKSSIIQTHSFLNQKTNITNHQTVHLSTSSKKVLMTNEVEITKLSNTNESLTKRDLLTKNLSENKNNSEKNFLISDIFQQDKYFKDTRQTSKINEFQEGNKIINKQRYEYLNPNDNGLKEKILFARTSNSFLNKNSCNLNRKLKDFGNLYNYENEVLREKKYAFK